MKNGLFFCAVFYSALCAISCTSRMPDEDTLLRHAQTLELYRTGRFAEAAKMLNGENKFVPSLVLRGKAEYLSGDLAAAEKSLERALSLNPHSSEAALYKARILRENGNAAGAQKIIEELLGDYPLDVRVLRFAAVLARDRGVEGEAASAALLERAVEASAETALVFMDRARLKWIGGNGDEALGDLGRARVLLPGDSPLIKSLEKLESVIREVSS